MTQNFINSKFFRIAAVLFGLFFLVGGALSFMSVFGLLPSTQLRTTADQIFVLLGGLLFTCAGLGIFTFGIGKPRLAGKLGAAALLAFVVVFNWIAFAPGERNFTRKVTTSWTGPLREQVAQREQVSEREGRIVFGAFSLLMDGLILYGVVKAMRRKAR